MAASAASSLVIRAGYGVYYDHIGLQTWRRRWRSSPLVEKPQRAEHTQQSAYARRRIQRIPRYHSDTFGIDPNFRPGYAQNWQLSSARSARIAATDGNYLGIKGTHGTQEFLPNTYPAGASTLARRVRPVYVVSAGNLRVSRTIQLRRRLHSGLAASAVHFAKSIDDDCAVGGQAPVPSRRHGLANPRGLISMRKIGWI